MHRRQFLGALAGSAAALTLPRLSFSPLAAQECPAVSAPGLAIPFQPDTKLPLRVRKSAYDLSPSEVERLRAAYAAMRSLV